jgi:hypothetical protein
MRPPGFLIVVDEGPGSPKGTGALFRATAVTPVNAEVQTVRTMKLSPRRPLMQIKDGRERGAMDAGPRTPGKVDMATNGPEIKS